MTIPAASADALAGKAVLITGGLGFIGSTLAHALVELDCRVRLVDALIPTHGGNLFNVAGIEDRVELDFFDLRDHDGLPERLAGAELVFALAGQTSHLDSMTAPSDDLDINCRAQLAVLEAGRLNNPEARIVFASTRQLYGRPQYLPVDERHPLEPVDVNGINKLAGERYHLLYGRVYGIAVSVLRLTNTYGPRMRVRDARQTFLGSWIRSALNGEELLVYGDGSQRRDFTYVDDAVAALCLAATSPAALGEVFNVGGPDELSLLELAELVTRLAGGGRYRLVPFPEDRLVIDIGDYVADDRKLRDALGWRPEVGLEEGLRRTLAFYREHGAAHYWDGDAA
jgi:UDP-glucose 4-epimerase